MNIKKAAIWTAILLLLLFAIGRMIDSKIEQGNWIDQNGRLSYPSRGSVKLTEDELEESADYTKSKIAYDSKGTKVHALLFKPKKDNAPAVIIAPAANAPKEGQEDFAKYLVSRGYATLIIDQRGIGETRWQPKSAQEEFDEFMQDKKETTEQLMVYDLLRAFDAMLETKGIDKNNIILEGESMGGRFAMIAAAIEPRIKGAVIISSSGYGNAAGPAKEYLDTVNPDMYVHLISPRRMAMFHSPIDKVVPIQNALATFERAKEPKAMIEMPPPCNHGNCDEIHDRIAEELLKIQNS